MSLDKFILVIWVFLTVCPEIPAINPFLEAKQTLWEREKKPEATDMPPGGAWLTGKTSGPKEQKDPIKSELSSETLLQQGDEPASLLLSGTPEKANATPRGTAP